MQVEIPADKIIWKNTIVDFTFMHSFLNGI